MNVYGELTRAQLENLTADPSPNSAAPGRAWWRTDVGRLKVDTGTNVYSALLNDPNLVIGLSATASQNVRLLRAGTGLLQAVLGNDATADGSASATPAQVSFVHENWATASLPAVGNQGRVVWDSTVKQLKVDTGSIWNAITFTLGLTLAVSGVKTANYTALSTDDVIPCDTNSIGAFTVTLPAANAGKKTLWLRKTTSDFNAVTLARAGSDTITDVSAGLTSTTISTQGEMLMVQSDGTSIWYVIERRIPSVWTAYTPSLTGSVSNPNLGSTGAVTGLWRRVGDSLEVMVDVITGGTGITAGSGNYLFSVPSGLTIASAKVPASGGNGFGNVFGSGNLNQSGVTFEGLIPCYNDTTTVLFYQISGPGQGSPVANASPNANWITTAGNGFSGRFTVPITNWNG